MTLDSNLSPIYHFFRNKEIQCFCLKIIKLNDIIQVKIKVVFGTTPCLASYQMYMKLGPLNLTIAKHLHVSLFSHFC